MTLSCFNTNNNINKIKYQYCYSLQSDNVLL